MKKIKRELLRGSIAQTGAGFLPLVIVLLLVAGCAPGGRAVPESVGEVPTVATGPTVSRFQDGREGFVLRELSNLDAASRDAFDQAVELLNSRDFDQAIELLEKVIERAPGVSAPYINLAMAYRQIDRLELAEEQLLIALELIPGHPVASNEYGLLLRKTGRFAEAREVYQLALAKFPEYLPVRRNLGILCDLYLDDRECALAQYETYSAAQPDDEQVKLWISELSLRLGR